MKRRLDHPSVHCRQSRARHRQAPNERGILSCGRWQSQTVIRLLDRLGL